VTLKDKKKHLTSNNEGGDFFISFCEGIVEKRRLSYFCVFSSYSRDFREALIANKLYLLIFFS